MKKKFWVRYSVHGNGFVIIKANSAEEAEARLKEFGVQVLVDIVDVIDFQIEGTEEYDGEGAP